MPYRQPFLFIQLIAARGPMSTARPLTCAEYSGGSTHRIAALREPYLAMASFSSFCCLARLRRPEVMRTVMPSRAAAAVARRSRCFNVDVNPSALLSSYDVSWAVLVVDGLGVFTEVALLVLGLDGRVWSGLM